MFGLLGIAALILAFLYFFGTSFDLTRDFTFRYQSAIGWLLVLDLLAMLGCYLYRGKMPKSLNL